MTTLGATPPQEVSDNYTIATTADHLYATDIPGDGDARQWLEPGDRDTKCGTLTMTSAGVRSVSGSGSVQDCW